MFFLKYATHGEYGGKIPHLTKTADDNHDFRIECAVNNIFRGTVLSVNNNTIELRSGTTTYAVDIPGLDLSCFVSGNEVVFICASEVNLYGTPLDREIKMLLPYDKNVQSFINGICGIKAKHGVNYVISKSLSKSELSDYEGVCRHRP